MITRFSIYLALALAGVLGITLSMPLEAPAAIFLGLAAVAVGLMKTGSVGSGRRLDRMDSPATAGSESKESSRGRDLKGNSWGLDLKSWGLSSWCFILAVCGTFYFVIRSTLSPVIDLGMADLMLILPSACLYFVAAYGVDGKSGIKLRQGLAWTVIALLLCHLGSVAFQLQGESGYSLARYFTRTTQETPPHITGMYGYYGSFANFAVIAGMLCLSLGVWGRMAYWLRAALFTLGVIALGMAVYSGSRSAAMGMVVALIVFCLLLSVSIAHQSDLIKRRFRICLVVFGLGGLALGVAGGLWVFQERAKDSEVGFETLLFDSAARTQYWSMAAEQWADNPIVGAGSRSFSYECFRYWNPNMRSWEANPEFVHNEYLQLLADYGLIGLLLILGLFGVHFYTGGRQIFSLSKRLEDDGLKRGSNAMAFSIAGMCGMAAMAVNISTDFRTHLLANLLLLVCCAVWVLPLSPKGRSVAVFQFSSFLVGRLVLCVFGMGALALAGYQLWGGMPLLENRIAKEDDAWNPEEVDRNIWIPALEESLSRVPMDVRYLRLGTLYQIEANNSVGEEKGAWSQKAIEAYEVSVERNAFNPIPKTNLAGIYAEAGEFQKADEWYALASEMAKARERWFRMHSKWANLHQRWAEVSWRDGKNELAETHFLRAKELYKQSYEYGYFYQNAQWIKEYTGVLTAYARFLDNQKRFDDAEVLFLEGRKQVNWVNMQRQTALNFFYAQHLYDHGYATWMNRNPEEAYLLMQKAKSALAQYKRIMKGKVGNDWDEEMKKIQEVIDFLEKTGVKSVK